MSDKLYKNNMLRQIDSLIAAKYVLPDKAIEYALEFERTYESGRYDSCTTAKDFAQRVTTDLISITGDKHFHFRPVESSDVGEKSEGPLHHPIRYHRLGIKENKGFARLEWLDGNVGYLDVRRFYNYKDVEDLVAGAMRFLANANAIIIDVREHGGGSGDYLSSYFLEYPTQLTGWYTREDDFLTESWTLKDIKVKRLVDVPLFLLTSRRTFSAAESFVYDMKVRGRAVIVGDSTKGGAHSVDLYKIGDNYEIYIPTARAVYPVTGGNWEGTGVVPDVLVSAESALDTAVVLARTAGARYASAREAGLKPAIEEMQIQMDLAEALFRGNKKDDAGAALKSVFETAQEYGLLDEFFVDVLAYNYMSREDEEILYAILQEKIEIFPDDPAGYENLAYAYYKNGRKELAIACFEKVLERDPENKNAVNWLERIRNK